MISDVPVGAFLSGGVDSSAIVALMRDQTQQEIKTFTVDFEGQPAYSELEFAKSVSNRYNTNHFVKTVSKKDTLEFISRITEIYDEPQADTTAIPIYFISKLARENNIKVVLNGDGPDELFAGYSNYARYVRVNSYYNLASHAPKFIKGISSLVLNRLKPNTPISEMSSRLYNDQELMWPGASGIKESNKRKILSKEFMQKLGSYSSYDHVKQLKKDYQKYMNGQDSDYIQWLCYSGYKQAVIEKFLFRADRLGMANSIEARSPFLDHEMIELALSIPSEYKIKNGTTKYILKKSLERILPNEVLYRKKMGFCLPIREWAADTIGDYVLENINQFAKETGWFNQHEVIRQVKSLKNGKDETTNNIWTIYFLINWYKKWF
jgi:asparagine synthase (glutamine-hydrolysing)